MRIRLMPLDKVATLAPGERLLDVLDESGVLALPTACRSANCGICTVIVCDDRGLAPPLPDEERFLAALGVAASQRLGCQIHAAIDSGDEEVVVEILAGQGRR